MSYRDALDLAEQIVAAQGTRFIREFLRDCQRAGVKVRLGATKGEALSYLKDAIRRYAISFDDLVDWLLGVEGWGRQHVYLYRFSANIQRLHLWKEPIPTRFQKAVRSAGLTIPRESQRIFDFPGAHYRLGKLSYDGSVLEAIWRRGISEWRRDSSKDREERITGDLYRFRAWRYAPLRSVMRFMMFPEKRVAALFVQAPLGANHEDARSTAWDTVGRLFDPHDFARVNISDGIKAFDDAAIDEERRELPDGMGSVSSQATTFSAHGAAVAFTSENFLPSYASVTAVRHVRRAVRLEQFAGSGARFVLHFGANPGMKRAVKVSMDGHQDRIYFFAQMTSLEVWAVLDYLTEMVS